MLKINSLSKCPFCGGDALFDCDITGKTRWVECKKCHAKTRTVTVKNQYIFETEDEADAFLLGAWERRENE